MNHFAASTCLSSRKTFYMFGAILLLAGTFLAGSVSAQRVIRATTTTAQPGGAAVINIQLDSQGNESSASYTINFNPAVLTNPVIVLGNGVPANSNLGTNTTQAAQGIIGILVDSTNTYAAGTRNMVNITFTVAANATAGTYPITFSSSPTPQSVSSSTGALLPTTYASGAVVIGTTAAGVAVSGRVLTPDGRGIRNASVIITDVDGIRRVATTSSFGFYRFEDVEAGATYTISVASKQYRFTPRIIQVVDSLTDFDFVGQQ